LCHRTGQPAVAEAQTEKTKACYQLAVFREPETAVVRTLINCVGGHRLTHAYLSESSVVEVEFLLTRNQLKNQLFFMLHYTGETVSSLPVCMGGAVQVRSYLDEKQHYNNTTMS